MPRGHVRPHPPQCVLFVIVSVSQPFAALMSQSPNPGKHAAPHDPSTHTPFAFGNGWHA